MPVRLPVGSREAELTLNTDNVTSTRFLETLSRLSIAHRRTPYHHPERKSYIGRFHRGLKEEEVWVHEDQNMEKRASIDRWLAEHNQERPHQSLKNRTPREAFLAWQAIQLSKTRDFQF